MTPETAQAGTSPIFTGLPAIDQIGIVVRSMDAAVKLYEPLFGPFVVLDNGPFEAIYRGQPAPAHLIVAFGRSGSLEIELVEWISGATPHRDFLLAGCEGLQHLRYPVEDVVSWVDRAGSLGYESIWSGEYRPHNIRWAYLARPDDPLTIEFVSKCA